MATFTNQSRNSASFTPQLRHGKEPKLSDMENKTFNDPLYADSSKPIKEYTFEELQDQEWTNQTKNQATFNNQTRN